MNIRVADEKDIELILSYDSHIAEDELRSCVLLGRVIVAECGGQAVGWLRWGLFWDNTPFMNMLFLLEDYRYKGYGRGLVSFWEGLMREKNYKLVMTSTLSNETAQHFYRRLSYVDAGSLLLKDEPLEIIFTKEL